MFEIRVGEDGEVVMTGRLDAAQCDKALKFLDAVTAPHVIELRGLDYISSAGLGVLLKTQKRLSKDGGKLRLVGASRHLFDIFKFSGLDMVVEIQRARE